MLNVAKRAMLRVLHRLFGGTDRLARCVHGDALAALSGTQFHPIGYARMPEGVAERGRERGNSDNNHGEYRHDAAQLTFGSGAEHTEIVSVIRRGGVAVSAVASIVSITAGEPNHAAHHNFCQR